MLINFCRSAVGLVSTTTPGVNDNVKKIAGIEFVVFGEESIRSFLVTLVRSNQYLSHMCQIDIGNIILDHPQRFIVQTVADQYLNHCHGQPRTGRYFRTLTSDS